MDVQNLVLDVQKQIANHHIGCFNTLHFHITTTGLGEIVILSPGPFLSLDVLLAPGR